MNETTSKILTVIVPSYNMERYLTQCLESITSIENVADIDLVVVNDGSTDRSSEIAHGFAARFSNSVSVIDKPNGHYGSCVNVGLAAAKGKYVKIVDADDWVDSANFQKLVSDLRECDADLVFCQYVDCYEDGRGDCVLRKKVNSNILRMSVSELVGLKSFRPPFFHACIFYKTYFLRAIGYRQVEKCLYSDLQWTSVPMASIASVACFHYPVYMYRKERPGQSLSPAVRKVHIGDEFLVRKEIIANFERSLFASDENKVLCEKLICRLVAQMYRETLVKKEIPVDVLREFDDDLRNISMRIYRKMNGEIFSGAFFLPYVWLWRHNCNKILDTALALRGLFSQSKK